MKKIMGMLLLSIGMLILTSCKSSTAELKENNETKEISEDNSTENTENTKNNNPASEKVKVENKELTFTKITGNRQEAIDGMNAGITGLPMAIVDDVLFFVDLFDDSRLKVYDIAAGEITCMDITAGENEYGKVGVIYTFNNKDYYYNNGIALYKLNGDKTVNVVLDNISEKNIVAVDNQTVYYTEKNSNTLHILDLQDLSEKSLESSIQWTSDSIVTDKCIYCCGENKLVSLDITSGEEEVIYESSVIMSICVGDNNSIIINDFGKIYQYNVSNGEIGEVDLKNEMVISVETYDGGTACLVYDSDCEKLLDLKADSTRKYSFIIEGLPRNEFSANDYIVSEKYVVIYSAAKDTGLYIAVK